MREPIARRAIGFLKEDAISLGHIRMTRGIFARNCFDNLATLRWLGETDATTAKAAACKARSVYALSVVKNVMQCDEMRRAGLVVVDGTLTRLCHQRTEALKI